MNLHRIAGRIVAAVNPSVAGYYQASIGTTTAADGKRTPAYANAVKVQIQMQALSWKDLQQLSGINMDGERHAMYITGQWEGISRPDARGGDLVTLLDGSLWLVVQVLENWATPDCWTKIAVTRQGST